MGIVNNFSIFHGAGRLLSGTEGNHRAAFGRGNSRMNRFSGEAGVGDKTAIPNGCLNPQVLAMPRKSGGLSSSNELSEEISVSAVLVAGLGMNAALSGTLDLTDAQLGLIVALAAGMSGSISTTDALLVASAALAASLSGSISTTDAQLGAISSLVASLSASISSSAGIFATADMEADMSVQNEFSASNLASAVWDAVSSSYNSSGSMGEKLNDAGSASNPWTEVIEGSYTATEVLRLLLAVAAGKTSIVDNGGGSATVTFRDSGDSKNRVVADMVNSERDSVTLDAS